MTIKASLMCTCAGALLLAGGCGGDPKGDLSPKRAFEEFAAALTSFSAQLSMDEPLASEDLFASVGELRGTFNSLRDVTADQTDVQAALRSMQETMDAMDRILQGDQDLTAIRSCVAKLHEQSANLQQQLASK